MAFNFFDMKERRMLSESVVAESYVKYLQDHFTTHLNGDNPEINADHANALDYEEFKEYHVLWVIGRDNEFTANIAKDYQNTEVLKEKSLSDI